jgi:hypothetical protein
VTDNEKLLAAASDPRILELIFTKSPSKKSSKEITEILKEYGIK